MNTRHLHTRIANELIENLNISLRAFDTKIYYISQDINSITVNRILYEEINFTDDYTQAIGAIKKDIYNMSSKIQYGLETEINYGELLNNNLFIFVYASSVNRSLGGYSISISVYASNKDERNSNQ